ncbi:MAG TPA: cellulose biosynthesis cyclic di-GMP-binding regulatory protein BcsB, partial [Bordetella sp.]
MSMPMKWTVWLVSCVLASQAVAQSAPPAGMPAPASLLPGGDASASGTPAMPAPPPPPGSPGAPGAPAATSVAGASAMHYSLEQLGAQYAVNLRGVDGSNSLEVGVRDDQVVTGARLNLRYAYSPALLPDLSHINVLVNDQVATSIALPKETGGTSLQRTIELPPYLFTSFSTLRLQLIGHYTMQCEDPLHSSLWANISNRSMLDVETEPLLLPNDLASLPVPFFDRHDRRRLDLPFVFASNPSESALESAGVVSSWFGALAGYRGARFPVTV